MARSRLRTASCGERTYALQYEPSVALGSSFVWLGLSRPSARRSCMAYKPTVVLRPSPRACPSVLQQA